MTPSEYIYQLPKAILNDVLLVAMREMQGYNGRSISDCIVIAVDGEIIEGVHEDGSYKKTYQMPKIAQIKRDFS